MLTAILLSRVREPASIPAALLQLRSDFSGLREALTKYDRGLVACETIDDFQYLHADLEKSWEMLIRRIDRRDVRMTRRVFDVARTASLSGALKEVLKQLLTMAEERISMGRLGSFVSIWREASNIPEYDRLVERVFGKGLSDSEFIKFQRVVDMLWGGKATEAKGLFV